MTDGFRGGKPQGWRGKVAEGIVKVSWWRGQPALYYGTALISFLMFHAHGPIGKIINSEEICSNETFMEKMSLVVPKLQKDCDLIATTLSANPYKEIALVLDLWIFMVFVFSIPLGIFYAVKILNKYKEREYINYPTRKKIFFFSAYIIMSPIFSFFVIFESSLIIHGIHQWIATLKSYGIGAAIQTGAAGMPYIFTAGHYHGKLLKWSDHS